MTHGNHPTFRFFRQRRRLSMGVLLAAYLSIGFGCGVGEYRERLDARVSELATRSETAELYAPQPLGSKPVTVRVPQAFKRQPLVAGAAIAEEGAPPDEVRVKPGVVDLPGLTYTYEEFVADAEGGQIPYYLYVGAQDKTLPGFRDPTSRLLNQIKERLPGQEVTWENVDCDTPDGRSVPWRRLRAEGEQDFYYVGKDGKGRTVKLPGLFEVYYRTDGDWAVALAWRVPTVIEEHVSLEKWGPLVAGTVNFQGLAE